MTVDQIYAWMDDSSSLTTDTLEELRLEVSKYPYFQPLWFLYLKNLYQVKDKQFFSVLEAASVNVADRKKLFYYLSMVEGLWNHVYQHYATLKQDDSHQEQSDTISLIDSFLSEFSPELLEQKPHVTAEKKARLVAATTDYASLLLSDEQLETSDAQFEHHGLIDSFITYADDSDTMRKQFNAENDASEETIQLLNQEMDILDEEDLLTESLAKIYIKQKRYYKAIEIIRKLSLKYPEKSIYFADQIRFLETLITNIKKQ